MPASQLSIKPVLKQVGFQARRLSSKTALKQHSFNDSLKNSMVSPGGERPRSQLGPAPISIACGLFRASLSKAVPGRSEAGLARRRGPLGVLVQVWFGNLA